MNDIKQWLKSNNIPAKRSAGKTWYNLRAILSARGQNPRTASTYYARHPDKNQVMIIDSDYYIDADGIAGLFARSRVTTGPGQIYFAISEEGGFVKIGYSRSPENRKYAIIANQPYPDLTVIGAIPGTPTTEKAIHNDLAPHRRNGEWYHLNDQTRKYIKIKLTKKSA